MCNFRPIGRFSLHPFVYMRLFPQALRTQPNNPDALTRKGDSLGMCGDDGIALNTLRCAATGQILRALNRDKEAVETERRVLQLLKTEKGVCTDGLDPKTSSLPCTIRQVLLSR